MRATTDLADSLIPAMSLDSPSDNAMTALYRVALGPVNTDYYLPVFARFDTTGRATTSWNWAASLCTLNWAIFRQVWSGALVYVAAAEGLALLVFALGRQFLNWPPGVELGVLAAFGMLAFAVPGLYGNAILHADVRRRISRALAASRTVPEACALLEQRASTRKRLQAIVGVNVALAIIAMAAYLSVPRAGFQADADTSMTPAVTVAQASSAAAAASAQAAAQPTAAASTPAAEERTPAATRPVASAAAAATSSGTVGAVPAAAPVSTSAPAPTAKVVAAPPAASTQAPTSTPVPTPVTAPVPAPAAKATAPAQASAPAAPAPQAAPAANKAASAPSPATKPASATPPSKTEKAPSSPAATKAEAPASKPAAPASKADAATATAAAKPAAKAASKPAAAPDRAARTSQTAKAKPSAAAASATAAASSASDAASAPLTTVGSTAGYYINVGLFADEANARKAQARLLNEGLPAFRQELNNSKGRRIRVRVGPYDSRAQAAAAAESIRAMDLDAVVFKQ